MKLPENGYHDLNSYQVYTKFCLWPRKHSMLFTDKTNSYCLPQGSSSEHSVPERQFVLIKNWPRDGGRKWQSFSIYLYVRCVYEIMGRCTPLYQKNRIWRRSDNQYRRTTPQWKQLLQLDSHTLAIISYGPGP